MMILYPWVILIMEKKLLIEKLETIREDLICLADLADSITDGNVASGIANELDDLIEALVEAEDENETSDEQQKPALYKGVIVADLGYTPEDGERYQEFAAYFTNKKEAKKETHKKAREFKKSGYYDSVKESVTEGKEGDWI